MVVIRVPANAGAKCRLRREGRLATRTRCEMLLYGGHTLEIELLVEIGLQAALGLGAIHVRTPPYFADAAVVASERERGATSRCRLAHRRPPRSLCTKD